jgi:hypothetical protein
MIVVLLVGSLVLVLFWAVGVGGTAPSSRCDTSTVWVECGGLGLTAVPWFGPPQQQQQVVTTSTTRVYLHDNGLTVLRAGALVHLPLLERLDLSNNRLRLLEPAALSAKQLPALKEVYLDGNLLVRLDPNTFTGLLQLQWIGLQSNLLQTLPPTLFTGLSQLEALLLDDNRLEALELPLFQGLPAVRRLGLARNVLTILPAALFAKLSSLETLDLAGNGLTILSLGNGGGGGGGDRSDPLGALGALHTLHLGKNRLQTVDATLLAALPALAVFDLSDNRVEQVDRAVEAAAGKLVVFSMAGNPSVCSLTLEPQPLTVPGGVVRGLVCECSAGHGPSVHGPCQPLTTALVPQTFASLRGRCVAPRAVHSHAAPQGVAHAVWHCNWILELEQLDRRMCKSSADVPTLHPHALQPHGGRYHIQGPVSEHLSLRTKSPLILEAAFGWDGRAVDGRHLTVSLQWVDPSTAVFSYACKAVPCGELGNLG